MIADPYGLGELLYATRPSPAWFLTAAAWTVGPLDAREFELAHAGCSISTFCKNPLHPGPCKGWKKNLGVQAPGALKAIEAARKQKLAERRVATSEAKSKASSGLTGRQLASPLHAKKATIKHANILLGNDEAKAGAKADKVILNKTEIKKYSKIKAAHVNSIMAKHGMNEDTGLEDRIAEALAEDNKTGKDDAFQSVLATSAASLGAHLAVEHCHKGNHKECDDATIAALREELTTGSEHALKTGDDGQLDKDLAAWDSGKLKSFIDAKVANAKAPPAAAEPEPAAAPGAPEPKKGETTAKAAFDGLDKYQPGDVVGTWQYKKDGQVKSSFEYRKSADGKGIEVWEKPAGFPGFKKQATWTNADDATTQDGSKIPVTMMAPTFKKVAPKKKPKPEPIATMDALSGDLKAEQHGADAMQKLNQWVTGKTLTSGAKSKVEQALKKEQADPDSPMIKKMAAAVSDNLAEKTKLYTGTEITPEAHDKLVKEIEGALHGKNDGKTPFADAIHDTWSPGNVGDQLAKDTKTAVGAETAKPWKPQDEYLTHAKKVAAGGYDANPLQQVGLAGLITKEDFDEGLTPEEQANLVAKLKSAHAVGNQVIKDKAAAVHKKLTGKDIAPESAGKSDFHEMFGPDGNPDHKQVVDAVEGMSQEDWDGLSAEEKQTVHVHVDDAKLAGEPGASVVKKKVDDFEAAGGAQKADQAKVDALTTALANPNADDQDIAEAAAGLTDEQLAQHLTPNQLADVKSSKLVMEKYTANDTAATAAKLADQVSPAAKSASDYAHGFKSGTAKQKMAAYDALPPEDFAQLAPNAQQLILADLKSIEKKFLDPKKKAAAKDLHNKLSVHTGGGAGSGGGLGAPNPAASTPATKAEKAGDFAAGFLPLIKKPDENVDKALLKDAVANLTTTPNGPKTFADLWAGQGVSKLSEMHADSSIGVLNEATLSASQGALAADIEKKLKGEDGPTPVLDAFTKAIKVGDFLDAQTFMEAAHGIGGDSEASLTPNPPADVSSTGPGSLTKAQASVALLWFEAAGPGAGKLPAEAPDGGDLAAAVAQAWGDKAKFDSFAEVIGDDMATASMKSSWKKAGLSDDQILTLSFDPSYNKINTALYEEFSTAMKGGHSVLPAGGANDQLHGIAEEVNKAAQELMAKNGWGPDNPSVQYLQTELMKANLQQLAEKLDLGGTTSPPTMVSVATLAPSAPSAPAGVAVGTGTSVDGVSFEKQQEILGDLKALPNGKYLSDPKETTYGNLLALAAAHGTADDPLSVMQVLKSVDNAFSAQLGVANSNKWENEFVDWLKTPDGSAFAKANPTADANLVKKFKGVYDGPTTDLQKLAEKVKLLPGPGAFKDDLPSTDFQVISHSKADELRKQMLAGQGGAYTPAQLSGLKTYTGSSYTQMNQYLRNEGGTLSQHYKTAIKNTQAAMRPLPENVLLHRGTGWEQLPEGFRSPAGAKKLIGKTVMDEAFMSTSVGGSAAFGGPLLLEIEAPKGTQAAFVEGSDSTGNMISVHQGEREMLLAAGQSFKVISATTKGHQTVLRIRIVTADAA